MSTDPQREIIMAGMSSEEVFQSLSESALKILQGSMAYEQALEQLDVREIGEALTEEIMVTLSRQALEFVKQEDPKWQPAIALETLLYVCVHARKEVPPVSVIGELAWNYVSAASRALWFVPDPSLYKQATKRGLAAVELLREQGNIPGVGDLLHALGTLNLDP